MAKKLTIFTLAALACIFSLASAAPNITVESKTVVPDQSFTVGIFLSGNDVDITTLRVPLKFDNTYLTCTYIDFNGSIIDASMQSYSSINGGEIEIAYMPPVVNPLPTITVESGLLATLYFSLDASAPSSTIGIDSILSDTQFEQYGQTFHLWRRVEVADAAGDAALIPSFTAGALEVNSQTAVEDEDNRLMPKNFEVAQNFPNPFNPTTTIIFSLPEKTRVRLDVLNMLGQNVATLVNNDMSAGKHEIIWDAGEAPSGVYFYRISAQSESITRKMLLLK
jgi:hypothetical protein